MKVAFVVIVCFVALSLQDATNPRFRLASWFRQDESESKVAEDERGLSKAQGRFLFWPWNLLFTTTNNYLSSTMFVTISTTMTSIVIARCIPATVFTNAAAQAASCRRRKRATHLQLEFQDEFSDPSHVITPSNVQHAAASAMPSMERSEPMATPELGTSIDDVSGRNLGILVAAITSTVTSYSITTTTFKTTAYLASATSLYCVPYGYTIC